MTALTGVRVIEFAAIGPAPFGVMLLADLGAEVIRVDRVAAGGGPDAVGGATMQGLSRGRRSIAADLKTPEGVEVARRLAATADVVVEGLRPGVMERLGLGPDDLRGDHPELIYARMTGWGQDGPLASSAGHDIDYAAVAGALHPIGRAGEPPPPPLNLVADFGGGGTYLAIGVLAALHERVGSGRGQVVDVAMVDGVASLTAFVHGLRAMGGWTTQRQANLLDGGAPFYDTYAAADGRFVAVGALEPQFYAALLDGLGLDPGEWPQYDRERWPAMRRAFAATFAGRTRDEWADRFSGRDACVAPVLDLDEAPGHPHLRARHTFVDVEGVQQPAPAPRLSRTPGRVAGPPPDAGEHTDAVLTELGYDAAAIDDLRERGAVA